MELKNKKDNEKSIFNSWIVNNRFSIFVLNTLLLFLTIFILSLIHISEPTRPRFGSRMPSSA